MVKNNLKHKTILTPILYSFVFLCLTISSITYAANITVKSSRNPIALDDSFHLIYEADSNVDGEPNFNPIYQHFDVLSSSQSTNMRSINGSWSLQKTWDLSVIAKDIGVITVPAISFGSDISPSIRITVQNSSSSNSATSNGQSTVPAKIFLESSIDKKQGWVQSQFIYTIRLLRTVSITGASIDKPTLSDPDAIIHQLTEDNYQTSRNGIRYEVFERHYAIYPQKSGKIKINPSRFEGRINSTQSRSLFDQFRMIGQTKRLHSDAITLDVQAAPSTINLQDWLPSSSVSIYQDWSDDIKNIKTGEPITRTITIAAEGLTAIQLPDLSFNDIDNLKQYPDKAVTEDKPDSNGITGLKQFKVALIPAQAGSYTLPRIKLQWWNTKTNKKEYTEIPEVVLTSIGQGNVAQTLPTISITTQQEAKSTEDPEKTVTIVRDESQTHWKWLTFIFATAWLITLILLLKKTKANHTVITKKTSASTKNLSSQIIKHAKQNNSHDVKSALIEWAKVFYHNNSLTNLSQITNLCSEPLKTEIRQLNHILYSDNKENWRGDNLLKAFISEQANSKMKPKKNASTLKPLYK